VNRTSYEAPHYAVFSSLPPLSSHLGPNILLSYGCSTSVSVGFGRGLNAQLCRSRTRSVYLGVSISFRTVSITKYMLVTINTRSDATQRVMAAKLTRLTHKIAIQLHLVAESCTIYSSRSRRPVRKLLDTPSYVAIKSPPLGTVLSQFHPASISKIISIKSILMLSSHLLLHLPRDFLTAQSDAFLVLTKVFIPLRPSWLHYPNEPARPVWITKFLVTSHPNVIHPNIWFSHGRI
jgi:hypothetical protein